MIKTTAYFDFRRRFPDRVSILDEWIAEAIRNPLRKETQSDDRIRIWGRVNQADGRILRVILLEDGETVHNAFYDRDFKELDS